MGVVERNLLLDPVTIAHLSRLLTPDTVQLSNHLLDLIDHTADILGIDRLYRSIVSSHDSHLGICLEPAGLGIVVCDASVLGNGILPVLRKGAPIVDGRPGNVTVKVVAELMEEDELGIAAVAKEVVVEAIAVG